MAMWDSFKKMAGTSVKDQMQSAKDNTNSAVFKAAMNTFIRKYGQVLELKIDSKDKAFIFEIMLKGEASPIRIEIRKYEFINRDGTNYVKLHEVFANRYWMDTVMELALLEQEFPLPKEFDKPIQTFM